MAICGGRVDSTQRMSDYCRTHVPTNKMRVVVVVVTSAHCFSLVLIMIPPGRPCGRMRLPTRHRVFASFCHRVFTPSRPHLAEKIKFSTAPSLARSCPPPPRYPPPPHCPVVHATTTGLFAHVWLCSRAPVLALAALHRSPFSPLPAHSPLNGPNMARGR